MVRYVFRKILLGPVLARSEGGDQEPQVGPRAAASAGKEGPRLEGWTASGLLGCGVMEEQGGGKAGPGMDGTLFLSSNQPDPGEVEAGSLPCPLVATMPVKWRALS